MNILQSTSVATLPSLDGIFSWLALTILGLAGALFLAESVGFLPSRFTRWLNRNRLSQTLSILEAFGIDIDRARKHNRAGTLDQTSGATLAERVHKFLSNFRLDGPVTIGRTFRQPTDVFYNLMGATTDTANARLLARDLSAKWRQLLSDPNSAVEDRFDFVATPKLGSPLLGAAFAELMRVPLALHVPEAKFESDKHAFAAVFDCTVLPAAGSRALVVDDSSTGGGKIINLVVELRRLGYQVSDVLVVFEPQAKVQAEQNAAERMSPYSLRLHAIIKT